MKSYRKHVLVCCTEGCCGARGGPEVFAAFRQELAHRSLDDVLVSQTLCSGVCPQEGATVIVHPDGLWYTVTKPGEVTEIVTKHLIAGQPVERLLLREIGLQKT
ncbi:MAG: (2Fe-2S) ferredoxin domain-containing protein [Candidatus Bipolaricaulia bacterium]